MTNYTQLNQTDASKLDNALFKEFLNTDKLYDIIIDINELNSELSNQTDWTFNQYIDNNNLDRNNVRDKDVEKLNYWKEDPLLKGFTFSDISTIHQAMSKAVHDIENLELSARLDSKLNDINYDSLLSNLAVVKNYYTHITLINQGFYDDFNEKSQTLDTLCHFILKIK